MIFRLIQLRAAQSCYPKTWGDFGTPAGNIDIGTSDGNGDPNVASPTLCGLCIQFLLRVKNDKS